MLATIIPAATASLGGRAETASRRHAAAVLAVSAPVVPQRADVERLEAALRQYRDIAARGGWPTIPSGQSLHAGDRDPSVPLVRHRLGIDVAASDLFDAALEQAVQAFQVRHGLEADGIVGRKTRGAMNVTAAERVRQLEINLERLRTRSDSLPVPRIEVNIAAQMLRYFDPKGDVLEMRTIVGRRDWPTPIFEAKVKAIVLAPYWNVPTRIASLELIPAIRRDPGYLARNDMEVVTMAGSPSIVDPATIDWSKSFPHRIRQRPGPRNPLGDVKFLLPNRFDVYLHDTPGRAAFVRADRALSHGCVRLERALDLATVLLAGRPEGAVDSMRAVIAAGRERTIRLDHGVPVILYYQTAWVESDGTVTFREDIYGHDRRAAPLAEPASHESECAA